MTLLTIQDNKVLNNLLNNKTHIGDFYYIIDPDDNDSYIVEAYQKMMRHYGYDNVPIFCCVFDKLADFSGVIIKPSSVLLKLSVPDEFVKLQVAEHWRNIMNYFYFKYDMYIPAWSPYDILDVLDGKGIDNNIAIQATIPYIKPEWLMTAYDINEDFIKIFRNTIPKDNKAITTLNVSLLNKRFEF